MAGLQGTQSADNLRAAFAGELQANRRYLYFARRADIEATPKVGRLFRDISESETGHAFRHRDFLKETGDPATGEPIGNTEANLKAAVAGETYEYSEMYPGFARMARGRRVRRAGRVVRDAGPRRALPRRPVRQRAETLSR